MKALMAIRVSGAAVVVPGLFGLGVWAALSELASSRSGYPVADLAVASQQVVIIAPLLGAYVAFRLGPFFLLLRNVRALRGRAVVLARVWWPVLIGGPVACASGMLSVSRVLPTDLVALEVLGVSALAVATGGVLGALLVRSLPRILAIPVVAGICLFWLGYPQSRTWVLPRNLNSSFVACCTDLERPASGLVLGSTVLDAVVLLGGLLIVGSAFGERSSRATLMLATIVLLGGAVAFGTLAARSAPGRLRLTAVDARTTAPSCARAAGYQVCTWPENRSGAARVLRALEKLDRGLAAAGLDGIRSVSERPGTPGSVQASLSDSASSAELRYALAWGYTQARAGCDERHGTDSRSEGFRLVALLAGLSAEQIAQVEETSDLPDLAVEERAKALPPSALRAWFAARTCNAPASPGSR